MKKIIINKGFIGLVFRKGDYKRVLTAGSHWIGFYENVELHDISKMFQPHEEINILLKDKTLSDMLTEVLVKDGEIVLHYTDGIFFEVLTPGRYFFWKDLINNSFKNIDLNSTELINDEYKSIVNNHHILPYIRVYQVNSYERGLLYINDKFEKELGEGQYHFWYSNTPISLLKADMRQQQIEISGQEILTKDKAAIRVNFFAQYSISNIHKALTEIKDYEKQLYIFLQLSLREYVGTFTLDELLEKKQNIKEFVLNSLTDKVDGLGIKLIDGGVRDIILPGDVKEIMNQVLVAQKKAQANIITRKEETASTRSLLNTAKLMEENEMLYKLKEMEYVEKIADKINSISLSGGGQVVNQLKEIFT